MRPTHAGHGHVRWHPPAVKPNRFALGDMVKNRNEPACLRQVVEVVAGARGITAEACAAAALANTRRLFFGGSA